MTDASGGEWLGRTLGGRFEILRALGEGGMGAVYAARDTTEGGEVALKVLLPELAAEARHLARFRREAEVMGLLAHPHVVRAIASGVDADGTPWLAMELVQGETLSSFMRERASPLGVQAAVGIARQIVAALMAAHEVGIVHRDLKPANVMIERDGGRIRAKVVDFGLARFADSTTYHKLTMTGVVVGTPSYMAPEQAFGDPVDHRADLYAVGAVLHALLTSEPPFGSGKSPDLLPRLLAGERTRLTETRRDLGPIVEVVERLLEPEPEQRYETAAALDAALAPFDAKVPSTREWTRPPTMDTLALPPDPVLDAPRPRRRGRTRMAPPDRALPPAAAQRTDDSTRSRASLLILGFVVAVAASAGLVYLVAGLLAQGPAPSEGLAAVMPVAMLDGAADGDGAQGAPEATGAGGDGADRDAGASSDAAEQPTEARAHPGPRTFPAPAAYSIRVEILESYAPANRFTSTIREETPSFAACLARRPRIPRRPPLTWTVRVEYSRPSLSRTFIDPSGDFDVCIYNWEIGMSFPSAPTGASTLVMRVTAEAATPSSQRVVVLDRTDWASRTLTPPYLSVDIHIEHTNIAAEEVKRLFEARREAFDACLKRSPGLERPPPYAGTMRRAFGDNPFVVQNGTPHIVALCLEYDLFRHTELPDSAEIDLRFRATAAERTTIEVHEQ